MKTFQPKQQVTLTKTPIINDRKFVGKKGVVDFQCKDGMVWVKFGRSARCLHPDSLELI